MRLSRSAPVLFAVSLATISLSAAAVAGCGGTNSETPWPVEPMDVDLGPEGEVRGNEQLGAPPSSGAKPAVSTRPVAAPEEAEEAEGKPAEKPAGKPAGKPAKQPTGDPRAPEPSSPSSPATQF